MRVPPIPDGYHAITPRLTVRGAASAIEFYKKAFGAEEISRCASPDGTALWHATVTDPYGHHWSIATQKEFVTFEKKAKRTAAMKR